MGGLKRRDKREASGRETSRRCVSTHLTRSSISSLSNESSLSRRKSTRSSRNPNAVRAAIELQWLEVESARRSLAQDRIDKLRSVFEKQLIYNVALRHEIRMHNMLLAAAMFNFFLVICSASLATYFFSLETSMLGFDLLLAFVFQMICMLSLFVALGTPRVGIALSGVIILFVVIFWSSSLAFAQSGYDRPLNSLFSMTKGPPLEESSRFIVEVAMSMCNLVVLILLYYASSYYTSSYSDLANTDTGQETLFQGEERVIGSSRRAQKKLKEEIRKLERLQERYKALMKEKRRASQRAIVGNSKRAIRPRAIIAPMAVLSAEILAVQDQSQAPPPPMTPATKSCSQSQRLPSIHPATPININAYPGQPGTARRLEVPPPQAPPPLFRTIAQSNLPSVPLPFNHSIRASSIEQSTTAVYPLPPYEPANVVKMPALISPIAYLRQKDKSQYV